MIQITKTKSRITIKGHANDSEHPRCDDTIRACEAVTAVSQTLLFGIHELCGESPDFVREKGHISIDIEHLSERAQFLVDAFCIGCKHIAEAYPYITFTDQAFKSLNCTE